MAGPGLPPSWPSPSSSSTPRSSTGGRGWSYFLRPGTSTFQLPGINKKVKFRLCPNILLIRIQRFSYLQIRKITSLLQIRIRPFLGLDPSILFSNVTDPDPKFSRSRFFSKIVISFFNKPVPFLNKTVKKWWSYCGSGSDHFLVGFEFVFLNYFESRSRL